MQCYLKTALDLLNALSCQAECPESFRVGSKPGCSAGNTAFDTTLVPRATLADNGGNIRFEYKDPRHQTPNTSTIGLRAKKKAPPAITDRASI